MAKDGTNRGGRRANSGRKRKPAFEKIENNTTHRPVTVIEAPDEIPSLVGTDMPKVADYLSAKQRDREELIAGEIYKETLVWLKSLKVDHLVSKKIIETYAISCARWQQCQEAITKYGFLGKHPTSGAPIKSPYVAIQNDFFTDIHVAWDKIYQIVKDNCTTDYRSTDPRNDIMEKLLRKRELQRKEKLQK